MPAPLDVDREAVKTLALAIGLRPASKQTGIPLPTLAAWSARYGWFKPVEHKLPPTMQPVQTVQTNSASDALKLHLAEDHNATKLDLSAYARAAAAQARKSNGNHKLARSTKDVADIMEKVHGSDKAGSGGIHIGLLTGQVAIQYKGE